MLHSHVTVEFHVPSSWQTMVADPMGMYPSSHLYVTVSPGNSLSGYSWSYTPFSAGAGLGQNTNVKMKTCATVMP